MFEINHTKQNKIMYKDAFVFGRTNTKVISVITTGKVLGLRGSKIGEERVNSFTVYNLCIFNSHMPHM